MKVNFAHLRDKNTDGGWIDYIVFDAHAQSFSDADNGYSPVTARPVTARAVTPRVPG
jgi:hypothetical protein